MSNLKEIIAGFHKVSTASAADAVYSVTQRRGYMDHVIKPRVNDKKVVGPAVTVQEVPTDEELPPQHALDLIDNSEPGAVLVIGIGGYADVAIFGGLMAAGASVNGFAGAVLDGGVRDVSEIRRDYDFPVYSRSVSPGSTVGHFKTTGANIPVECGGITVNAGDIVVADPDGVVIVPRNHAEAVLAIALDIEEKEAEQARYIRETKSLKMGLAKYQRI